MWYQSHLPTYVSIPFEQGDVFRQEEFNIVTKYFNVSIPFDQGNVFRLYGDLHMSIRSLSQSLSSRAMSFDNYGKFWFKWFLRVSIPFEQGDVFRQYIAVVIMYHFKGLNPFRAGRCLSTQLYATNDVINNVSQSLSSRAMPFDSSCVAKVA